MASELLRRLQVPEFLSEQPTIGRFTPVPLPRFMRASELNSTEAQPSTPLVQLKKLCKPGLPWARSTPVPEVEFPSRRFPAVNWEVIGSEPPATQSPLMFPPAARTFVPEPINTLVTPLSTLNGLVNNVEAVASPA